MHLTQNEITNAMTLLQVYGTEKSEGRPSHSAVRYRLSLLERTTTRLPAHTILFEKFSPEGKLNPLVLAYEGRAGKVSAMYEPLEHGITSHTWEYVRTQWNTTTRLARSLRWDRFTLVRFANTGKDGWSWVPSAADFDLPLGLGLHVRPHDLKSPATEWLMQWKNW